ncbi:CDP-glycerol glycerophosphotransferase family protein [Methanobrevibacter sp.]|uniref:CDP-glycerol glycerophosphotransferase family protein n=1 Tax=Methanobrevibacter sp. TaxID=66852 RepID=UPI002E78511C|nr:CDP-glycerol glycerophosphotransferase family protein [Methanobrevibacter sp.]MEE1335847.1 CDP-glycerol glycerophosphotransferase family protein [Methanobrevibacter sp.]
MNIKSKSKNLAKRFINRYASYYTRPTVDLKLNGDEIIVKTHKRVIPNSFIEIKHRLSGRRLVSAVKSSTAIFSVSELMDMAQEGTLDLYFKVKMNNIFFKKRIFFTSHNQFFKAVSYEHNLVLNSYKTNYGNLSIKIDDIDFDYSITELKVTEGNKILIKGNFSLLNDDINAIDKVTIIANHRRDSQSNVFDLNFNVDESNSREYEFEGIIDDIKSSSERILDLRMDFYIRIYDDDIYYQSLIDLSTFRYFENDEDRFLIKINDGDTVYSYYATENKHSLALWITTESAWMRSYTIACGRTIYSNASKNKLNEKMIFFESFFGKSYTGNPKYLYEAMLEMGMDKEYTFVWAYSGDDKEIIPGNPIIVDRFEPGDYYKYLALSKYWINNIIFPIHTKRPGNVYLQTWHGTPLKKLGYDITIPGPEVQGRENFYNESRNWDYLISSNPYSTKIFKRAFKYDKEVLEDGYPINDIFFKDNAEFVKKLKSKLGIEENKKIILYAPTWKDDEQNESWEHYFNLEIDLERLYEEFSDEYVVILKMHHLVSENLRIDEKLKDFAIDLSSYDDIQELYVLSDILITDYSSVFFDYAHSRRPILFFVPDLNHYIENVRGLYLNMEKELPGPLIKDNDELIDIIKNIDDVSSEYSDKYDEFYERFCSLCKGDSAKRIIEKVFK